MVQNIHIEMHNDHRHWLSDHAMWQDDLELWQKEIEQALAGLRDAEATLRVHSQGLQVHASEMEAEKKATTEHEHRLAEFERGAFGSSEPLLRMSKSHEEMAAQHARRRSAHERLKRHQHIVMAEAALLSKALARSV
jgi:folate-dependent tRNA-U54 methylase TrmFO/GidA